jgi:tRNA(Ile)-lysidine synthase
MGGGRAMGKGSELYRRWRHEVREQSFFHAGERVGVAVSGGADSILLLDFLAEFARAEGLALAAVHFNHHLRGKESDEDERFVAGRAKELSIEFLRGEADVARAASEKRGNLEAAARELRYRYFNSLLDHGRLDKLATAHTANDQAETVLLKLLRGAGTRGLAGIFPVLEGKIVRPFLGLTRREITAELDRRKLAYREDRTNLLPTLRRNKIRLELIPWLEKEFNPQIVPLLAELAERSREDEEVLEQAARERARPWRVHDEGEEKFPARALTELPPALARRVLRQMIQAASGGLKGVTHRHLEALERLTDVGQSGRQVLLPRGRVARREFDWLVVAPEKPNSTPSGFAYPVQAPGEVSVEALDAKFRFKIIELGPSHEGYNELAKAGLDLEKLTGELVLRNWREGDRFQPKGAGKPRKLKELFRERRIPARLRALWPLVECPVGIVWVRGFEPAAAVAAGPGARRILIVEEETGATKT